MSKRRRFFIFLSSAGIMFFFLYFSLSVRDDQPIKKWGQWLPGNKVKAMILDRYTADGQVVNKNILFADSVKVSLQDLSLTELEVKHNLRDGEVKFFNDKTQARKKPKNYYIELEINQKNYYTVIEVEETHSFVKEFGLLVE